MAMPKFAGGLLAVFAIVAIAGVSGEVLASEPRPNRSEWEAGKAQEAAAGAAAAAKQAKMAAVDKAVDLMEKLQTQVLAEGEKEAATYNKFACFCKDTTADKLEAISKGEDEKTDLVAQINKLTAKRDELDGDIQDFEDAIASAKKDMKLATEERAATKKVYEADSADLEAALDALNGAIKMLKGSKTPSLAQLGSVSQTLRTAATLADALSLGSEASRKAVAAFVQQPANEVQMEDYKFHSDDIIATLEGQLLPQFRDKKVEIDQNEVASVKVYDSFMQEKTHAVKTTTHKLENAKKEKQDAIADIEANSQQLSTVEANLLDDKEYTNKLSVMCTNKAKTWDQRTQIRAAEISTLTQAIAIVKGAITDKTTANTIRFAQQDVTLHYAQAVASDPAAMSAIEAAAENVEAPSFLQRDTSGSALAAVRRLRGAPGGAADVDAAGRGLVATLLKSKGAQLKSTLLTALASRIAADPFAKVKQLIQELIERLMQEAANESNQKGWCDKATADATQKKDYAAEEILGLNGEMAKLESVRDKLLAELAELATNIQEIKDARSKAEQERAEEKKEHEDTIAEAQDGLDALSMCIDLLDKFYKTINKETVDLSMAQQSPEEDAPDAGFDNGEAYTGAQSESGGILGMLDVMKSDFTRTITETEKAEREAQQDHLEFMTETGKSLAAKEEVEKQKEDQKDDTVDKLGEADDNLQEQTGILTTSIKELLDLKPTCVDTGMSYEERVALRENEIESLNKALCILGRYAEYGPDGAAEGC